MVTSALAVAVVVWCGVAGGFTLFTIVACARLARRIARRPKPSRWPRLWLLRPCEGDEPNLEANLASSLHPYPGESRVLLLVPSREDPSFQVAERIAARDPARVEVVVTAVRSTLNRKSAHLAVGLARAATAAAPPELIAQADSDICLDEGSLADVVCALGDDQRVAAAFAVPVEHGEKTFGDLAASGLLSASHQDFFALAAVAEATRGIPALAGPFAVHRRAALEQTGGFENLEELLGEDFEIGRRLHVLGLRIEVSALPARSLIAHRPFRQVLSRTARWATVVKRQRGPLFLSYPLLLAPLPVVLPAAAALAALGDTRALIAAGLLTAARTALAWQLRRIHRAPVWPHTALLLDFAAEVLMAIGSACAAVTSRVTWRGRRLEVLRGGLVRPAARDGDRLEAK